MTNPRHIYIDLGANVGDTVQSYIDQQNPDIVWAFEANPRLVEKLKERFTAPNVVIVDAAVWTKEGAKDFFLGHPLSGTIVKGKKKVPAAPHFEIDYATHVKVKTINFSSWLVSNVYSLDHVIVKMDIEGAEYKVTEHLVETGAINLIDELRCEFHQNRFPISKKRDAKLRETLAKVTKLVDWH